MLFDQELAVGEVISSIIVFGNFCLGIFWSLSKIWVNKIYMFTLANVI